MNETTNRLAVPDEAVDALAKVPAWVQANPDINDVNRSRAQVRAVAAPVVAAAWRDLADEWADDLESHGLPDRLTELYRRAAELDGEPTVQAPAGHFLSCVLGGRGFGMKALCTCGSDLPIDRYDDAVRAHAEHVAQAPAGAR